ncbi:MAG: ABC transporter permease subunit [Chloroflexi bacterium]|nr:ABC transporter permease subunit [Chloroflexota bacterium]
MKGAGLGSRSPVLRFLAALPGRSRLHIFLTDPASLLGLFIVAVIVTAALAAPMLAPHDPTAISLERRLLTPSSDFPLGTDHLGRDELSRLIYGARTTLGTASVVLLVVMTIAVTVGTISGYYGGKLDTLLMGLVDLLLAFPGLILALAIIGILGPSMVNVIISLALVSWAGYARLVRGLVLEIRERPFVEAAVAAGASGNRIVIRHILPNIISPVIVLVSLEMGTLILAIAGLNFLGLGVQPPTAEWGAMLNQGRAFFQSEPQLMIYPGVLITVTVLGFNLLGDGLRDVLDPRYTN